MKRRRLGIGLIELIIALAILGVLLTIVIQYFVAQADLSKRTQMRSQVQDLVRTVMQLATQDLQMAGSSHVIDGSTVTLAATWSPCTVSARCLIGRSAGQRDGFYARYVTSLRDTAHCREVRYMFPDAQSTTLRRGDTVCASPSTLVGNPFSTPPANILGEGILAMDITYYCTDSPPPNDPKELPFDPTPANATEEGCPASRPVRTARIVLVGQSVEEVGDAQDATVYATINGNEVRCAAGRVCYALEQEVFMPNLKGD